MSGKQCSKPQAGCSFATVYPGALISLDMESDAELRVRVALRMANLRRVAFGNRIPMAID